MSDKTGAIGDDIIKIYTRLWGHYNPEAKYLKGQQPNKYEIICAFYQNHNSLVNSLAYHAQNDSACESNLAYKVFLESVRNTVIVLGVLIELADKTWPEST